jgi:hypothetical protein
MIEIVDGEHLIDRIDSYSRQVSQKAISCGTKSCRHCGFEPKQTEAFTRHATRSRQLFVIVVPYVRMVRALLPRWRCPSCQRTFTEYPPFVIPYKRYTLPQMMHRAHVYVTNSTVSYRRGASDSGRPLFHEVKPRPDKSPAHEEDQGCLCLGIMAHTSLFHWVTLLGSQSERDQHLPHHHGQVHHRKYASAERETVLIECRRVCVELLRVKP